MKKPIKKTTSGLSRRLHFPEDEKRLSWLPFLLDAYAIADTGVSIAIRVEEKRRKVKLACAQGCGNCCVCQKDLPFYPHELVGIYWYVSEKMVRPLRTVLRDRLDGHTAGSACPFLVDNSCSIHQVRPMGCRQFNVFQKPCAEGEDPYYTRRDDVLVPLPEYSDRAFAAVLPFYNINIKQEIDPAQAIRLVRSQIMNLQSYDWKKLVAILDKSDTGKTK
ncbi:MAG TPA: YkgJ family cysteine cluster protein [Nitrospirota bacterium]|nr:YkgJ family cysteine cluster protein [Nitrospirota bacterium]